MPLWRKNRHYKWSELQRRHLESTAKACGLAESGRTSIEDLIAMTPARDSQGGLVAASRIS